ncbi:UNVERIFIED_CONTAM: hypothetical protein K2H54_024801 [Gekko kuhli]
MTAPSYDIVSAKPYIFLAIPSADWVFSPLSELYLFRLEAGAPRTERSNDTTTAHKTGMFRRNHVQKLPSGQSSLHLGIWGAPGYREAFSSGNFPPTIQRAIAQVHKHLATWGGPSFPPHAGHLGNEFSHIPPNDFSCLSSGLKLKCLLPVCPPPL